MARTREEYHQRRMQTCKHFNGIQNGRCNACISYERFRGDDVSLPCLPPFRPDQPPQASCESFLPYTPEEVAAQDAESARIGANICKARAAIIEHTGASIGKGASGKMKCPVCADGTLGYSVASLNGHVWGRCSTEDCVAWME